MEFWAYGIGFALDFPLTLELERVVLDGTFDGSSSVVFSRDSSSLWLLVGWDDESH